MLQEEEGHQEYMNHDMENELAQRKAYIEE